MSSTFFTFLWQANLYLILFYALYWVWLSRETFFTWNRVYLLGAITVALSIPLLPAPDFLQKTEVAKQMSTYRPVLTAPLPSTEAIFENENQVQNPEITPLANNSWQWIDYIWLGYWLIVGALLLRIFFSFCYLLYLSIRYPIKREKHHFMVKIPHKATFSFFNILFLGEISHLSPAARAQIISHELAHIKQWHSLDVVAVSLVNAFCWFNPICWMYMKSLRKVHEYLADEQVMRSGAKPSEYMELLLKEMLGQELVMMHNPFSKASLLKARCKMLERKKSSFGKKIKLLALIPLSCMALLFQWACTPDTMLEVKSKQEIETALPEGYKLIDTFFKNQNTPENEDFMLILAGGNEYMIRVSPSVSASKVILFDANYKKINAWQISSHPTLLHEILFKVSTDGNYNLKLENTSSTNETIQIDVAYKVREGVHEIEGVYSRDEYVFKDDMVEINTKLEANQQYKFSLIGMGRLQDGLISTSSFKAEVKVYNEANQLLTSFWMDTVENSLHTFTCKQSGVYTIKIVSSDYNPDMKDKGRFYEDDKLRRMLSLAHLIPKEKISR